MRERKIITRFIFFSRVENANKKEYSLYILERNIMRYLRSRRLILLIRLLNRKSRYIGFVTLKLL